MSHSGLLYRAKHLFGIVQLVRQRFFAKDMLSVLGRFQNDILVQRPRRGAADQVDILPSDQFPPIGEVRFPAELIRESREALFGILGANGLHHDFAGQIVPDSGITKSVRMRDTP